MPPAESGIPRGATGAHGPVVAASAGPAGDLRPTRSGSTRATPVALLALAGVLLVARVALGIYENVRPLERPSPVEWRQPGAGEAEARASRKLLLYLFTREGDPACRKLEREIFGGTQEGARINRRLVPIRALDLQRGESHNTPDVEALERRYEVKSFPTLVLARADQPRWEKQSGYPGEFETRAFLSRATSILSMPASAAPGGVTGVRDSAAAQVR